MSSQLTFHICTFSNNVALCEEEYESLLSYSNALGTPSRFVMTVEDYEDLPPYMHERIKILEADV
jgi:hypothetical protein